MKPTDFNDIVIFDQTESCPYLQGRIARMPLRMPVGPISPGQADRRLAEGHRRTGEFIYQTRCPACQACLPVRIRAAQFSFSANQKRVLRRGDRLLEQRLGPLVCDPERVELFNRHRRQRGLAREDADIDQEEYQWGFVRTCFDSFEITYWAGGRLTCLAVCDRTETSLSAVYTFFDPTRPQWSLGTYSILKQIEFCQQESLEFLYLGYYVAGSPHMSYKDRFLPQERLIDGQWQVFDRPRGELDPPSSSVFPTCPQGR